MANLSSGTDSLSSSSNSAVTAIANSGKQSFNLVRVNNTGAVAGFVSWDSGNTKHYVPANFVAEFLLDSPSNNSVLLYRIPDGTDISGLYVTAL